MFFQSQIYVEKIINFFRNGDNISSTIRICSNEQTFEEDGQIRQTARGRGRPRKIVDKNEVEKPKRGRGRPRKEVEPGSEEKPKRGRGRPRKEKEPGAEEKEQSSRGRGRPRKDVDPLKSQKAQQTRKIQRKISSLIESFHLGNKTILILPSTDENKQTNQLDSQGNEVFTVVLLRNFS